MRVTREGRRAMRGIEGRDASAPFAHRNAVDCCGREEDRLPHIRAKPKCLDELGHASTTAA